MSEDSLGRALEEHGHLLRKQTQSTTIVHLPDPDDPHDGAQCYALDGVPTRVLDSAAQIPMNVKLCKLCRGLDTGAADGGSYTADDIRELSQCSPEKVKEFVDERGTEEDGGSDD